MRRTTGVWICQLRARQQVLLVNPLVKLIGRAEGTGGVDIQGHEEILATDRSARATRPDPLGCNILSAPFGRAWDSKTPCGGARSVLPSHGDTHEAALPMGVAPGTGRPLGRSPVLREVQAGGRLSACCLTFRRAFSGDHSRPTVLQHPETPSPRARRIRRRGGRV